LRADCEEHQQAVPNNSATSFLLNMTLSCEGNRMHDLIARSLRFRRRARRASDSRFSTLAIARQRCACCFASFDVRMIPIEVFLNWTCRPACR